jgi:hypothetical protein
VTASSLCEECPRVFDGYAISDSQDAFQLILIMDRPFEPKVFSLENPHRLVIDLEPTSTSSLPRLHGWKHPILKGPMRTAFHVEKNKFRIVLDLLSDTEYNIDLDIFVGIRQLGEGARAIIRLVKIQATDLEGNSSVTP